MNIVQQPLAGVLLVGAIAFGVCASSGRAVEPILQAQPIYALLKSVKDKDQKQLQTVFSERLRAEFEEQGWDKVLQQYEAAFNETFGEYAIEDFAFEFSGDEEMGEVSFIFKGKKFPGLRVVKESGEWKMNER